METFIRHAEIKDSDTLGFIHVESCKSAYKGIIPDTVLNNLRARNMARYYYKVLTKKTQEVVLIFKDNKPAGYMSLIEHGSSSSPNSIMQVCRIYLLPSYRHQGLGTELINWGVTEAKNRGFKKIFLWVFSKNLSARKFYEKMGFSHDGTIIKVNFGKALTSHRYVKTF